MLRTIRGTRYGRLLSLRTYRPSRNGCGSVICGPYPVSDLHEDRRLNCRKRLVEASEAIRLGEAFPLHDKMLA